MVFRSPRYSVQQLEGQADASRLGHAAAALAQATLLASEAYERESGWREGIRSALARLLLFVDEEPALARLCVVEALGAGGRVLERRSRVLAELTEVIDRGRLATRATHNLPEVTVEGVVGAIFAVPHTRVLEGGNESLTDLLGRPLRQRGTASCS